MWESHKAFSINVSDLPLIPFENLLTKHCFTFESSLYRLIFDNFFHLKLMSNFILCIFYNRMWPNSGLHGLRPPSINGYGFRLIQTEIGSVVRWLRRKLYDLSEIHNLTERSCPKIYANLYYIQNRDSLTWTRSLWNLWNMERIRKYTIILWKVYDPKILKLNDHFAWNDR